MPKREARCPRCERLRKKAKELPGKYGCWFLEHPDERVDLEVWLEMAEIGETAVSLGSLQQEFVEKGFPQPDFPAFSRWMIRAFGLERYKAAVAGAAKARHALGY